MTDSKSDLDFCREIECTYKDELYSVRDNGAVLRYPHDGKRERKYDNQWIFGKPNKDGYLVIASVRVHSIIATAFHGVPPSKNHVVDHLDTNRQNNRPENLRWVTRLENILLNPITAKKIILRCGSIEVFLSDPSKFRDKFPEQNINWMYTVNIQEAQTSLERMLDWAKSDKRPSGGSLGKWILYRGTMQNQQVDTIPKVPDLIRAKTLNALQRNWRVPSEFPCCPQAYADEPLKAYADKLKPGLVFCQNNTYSSLVSKSALSADKRSIYIISESTEGESAVKPWALAKITYEDGLFVHSNLHNFFTQDGAEKQYCLAQGHEWTGGNSMDDYF
jgi:hypothetical protein